MNKTPYDQMMFSSAAENMEEKLYPSSWEQEAVRYRCGGGGGEASYTGVSYIFWFIFFPIKL